MSEKFKAYSLSVLIHLLLVFSFSYFLSSSLLLSNPKYLEIDLSLYELGEGEGAKRELKEVKKPLSNPSKSQKNVSEAKVYSPEKASKVKAEETKIEEVVLSNEGTLKKETEGDLAKGTGTGLRESGGGISGGSERVGEGVGKGMGPGTGMRSEELYLHTKLGIISKIVQNHISYPYIARKMGWEGKVVISFLLTKEGKVTNFSIERTSSYEILDQNAVETVKRCAKLFPLPPVDVKIKLPVIYQLN